MKKLRHCYPTYIQRDKRALPPRPFWD